MTIIIITKWDHKRLNVPTVINIVPKMRRTPEIVSLVKDSAKFCSNTHGILLIHSVPIKSFTETKSNFSFINFAISLNIKTNTALISRRKPKILGLFISFFTSIYYGHLSISKLLKKMAKQKTWSLITNYCGIIRNKMFLAAIARHSNNCSPLKRFDSRNLTFLQCHYN